MKNLNKKLAKELAVATQNLKNFLQENIENQSENFNFFRNYTSKNLTLSEFPDAFAQTLTFSMLFSKLNVKTNFLENINFSEQFLNFINKILEILNSIHFEKINFSSQNHNDSFLYFYQDFLQFYNFNFRKTQGVYYTPPEIANFIVRCAGELLQTKFNISQQFADAKNVKVLDFATGTGVFILEVLKEIFKSTPETLSHIQGFENSIPPFVVANLKISQFLNEKNCFFEENKRLKIILTNTLEPQNEIISQDSIFVILGNPPYSGHSTNKNKWILGKINDYKKVGDEILHERNPKWLQDDYVKFIRFAEWKIQQVEKGIVAIITNHSFLDNPTFCLMRKSLMQTFNQLYLVDLHGNMRKKEKSPDGGVDENVFNIMQGVSISFFVKKQNLERKIFYADFFGTKEKKFQLCLEKNLKTVSWQEIFPQSPNYLFKPLDISHFSQYEKYWSLKNIFEIHSVGIATSKDNLLICPDFDTLKLRIEKFKMLKNINEIKKKFNLSEKFNKKIEKTFENLKNKPYEIKKINYRIFDERFIWWETDFIERSRKDFMQQLENQNVAISTVRNFPGGSNWNNCFITNKITDVGFLFLGSHIFPLYFSKNRDKNAELFEKKNKKKVNFTKEFQEYLTNFNYSNEQIFYYIYAILFSPFYRQKYNDFLKTDFPKIPFTNEKNLFVAISELGENLANLHLFKDIPNLEVEKLCGKGNFEISKIKFCENQLYFNENQYFNDVSQDIFEFKIGNYRILEKFLEDRKILEHSDVEKIEKMIKIISQTLDLTQKIDGLTKNWV